MRVISDLAQAPYPLTEQEGFPERQDVFYRIAVRDLDVSWSIGVYEHEHHRMQAVRINLDLEAQPLDDWNADNYEAVPCYAEIAKRIQEMASEGHIKLVETLANRIAEMCLEDERIHSATVRVEKPEALENASSVGVEVTRKRRR